MEKPLEYDLQLIRENRIDTLKRVVEIYLDEYPRRCYQNPVKVNGWPFGYARTFKVISCKRRKRK